MVTEHLHLAGRSHLIGKVFRRVEFMAVGKKRDIAVLESKLAGFLAIFHTLRSVFERNIFRAPVESYTDINKYGENEVEGHAAYHHKQTLPRWLGTEIGWLGRLCKLFLVHGFINHSGYLHIASERKPAYAIFGVAP